MTRINSAIPVEHLTDEHLLAEHRELKRIPALLIKTDKATLLKRIPKKFCLGAGHITFFLNKICFTYDRYICLYNECKRRGFDVQYYGSNWVNIQVGYDPYWQGYTATDEERKLLVKRITERIQNSKKSHFHYHGKQITKQQAIHLLQYGQYT